jgi:hypothetical protein
MEVSGRPHAPAALHPVRNHDEKNKITVVNVKISVTKIKDQKQAIPSTDLTVSCRIPTRVYFVRVLSANQDKQRNRR